MLNSIIIMGRLTADPELKSTPSGVCVCSFTVAVDRDYQKQGEEKQTDFITVVAWRHTAEFVTRYFTKGRMIAVQGALQSRKWQDKDENKRVSWEIQAFAVQFCGDRPSEDNDSSGDVREVANRDDARGVPITPNSSPESFTQLDIRDEDLPF